MSLSLRYSKEIRVSKLYNILKIRYVYHINIRGIYVCIYIFVLKTGIHKYISNQIVRIKNCTEYHTQRILNKLFVICFMYNIIMFM